MWTVLQNREGESPLSGKNFHTWTDSFSLDNAPNAPYLFFLNVTYTCHWGSVYRNTNLLQIHFPKVKPPHRFLQIKRFTRFEIGFEKKFHDLNFFPEFGWKPPVFLWFPWLEKVFKNFLHFPDRWEPWEKEENISWNVAKTIAQPEITFMNFEPEVPATIAQYLFSNFVVIEIKEEYQFNYLEHTVSGLPHLSRLKIPWHFPDKIMFFPDNLFFKVKKTHLIVIKGNPTTYS